MNTPSARLVVTRDTLNTVMEFDHVITVHADGTVTEPTDIYAPTLYESTLDSDAWEMLNGYSGQDNYSGPIMHDSEYIGGGMADDILSTPGTYVAVVSTYEPAEHETEPCDVECNHETYVEGWAIARLIQR